MFREETAAAKQVESQQLMKNVEVDQFEDAGPRTGLGFASRQDHESSTFGSGTTTAGLGFVRSKAPQECGSFTAAADSLRATNASPALLRDEFGREIKHDAAHVEPRHEHQHKRSHGDESAVKNNQQQHNGDPRDRSEASDSCKWKGTRNEMICWWCSDHHVLNSFPTLNF